MKKEVLGILLVIAGVLLGAGFAITGLVYGISDVAMMITNDAVTFSGVAWAAFLVFGREFIALVIMAIPVLLGLALIGD